MYRTPISALSLALMLTVTQPVNAEDLASPISGVWKLNTFYQLVVATKEKRELYGPNVLGMVIFTKGGHFFSMGTKAERTQTVPAPTDAEALALFRTMFAYGGTYKQDGTKLNLTPEVAWAPSWVGHPHNGKFEVKGDTLRIETDPFKSAMDGADVIAVVEYTKAE
jgi:Lipocalin-like domain